MRIILHNVCWIMISKIITVGLRKQKELDAYPKPAQQIEFVERLKNDDG